MYLHLPAPSFVKAFLFYFLMLILPLHGLATDFSEREALLAQEPDISITLQEIRDTLRHEDDLDKNPLFHRMHQDKTVKLKSGESEFIHHTLVKGIQRIAFFSSEEAFELFLKLAATKHFHLLWQEDTYQAASLSLEPHYLKLIKELMSHKVLTFMQAKNPRHRLSQIERQKEAIILLISMQVYLRSVASVALIAAHANETLSTSYQRGERETAVMAAYIKSHLIAAIRATSQAFASLPKEYQTIPYFYTTSIVKPRAPFTSVLWAAYSAIGYDPFMPAYSRDTFYDLRGLYLNNDFAAARDIAINAVHAELASYRPADGRTRAELAYRVGEKMALLYFLEHSHTLLTKIYAAAKYQLNGYPQTNPLLELNGILTSINHWEQFKSKHFGHLTHGQKQFVDPWLKQVDQLVEGH